MPQLFNKVIFISHKKTSMRLATAEWEAVDIICKEENIKRNELIEKINQYKDPGLSLTCSVRLFTIIYFHTLLINTQQTPNTQPNQSNRPIYAAIDGIL